MYSISGIFVGFFVWVVVFKEHAVGQVDLNYVMRFIDLLFGQYTVVLKSGSVACRGVSRTQQCGYTPISAAGPPPTHTIHTHSTSYTHTLH